MRSATAVMNSQWLRTFRYLVGALVILIAWTASPDSATDVVGAALIFLCAVVPAYLWCTGRLRGIPIFPAYAATFVWTYCIPMLSANRAVMVFSSSERLDAAIRVTAFLILATVIWLWTGRRSAQEPVQYWALQEDRGDDLFLLALIASAVFNGALSAGWLALSSGLFAIVRGIVLALSSLGVFVLAYRLGAGTLRGARRVLFVILLTLAVMTNLTTLFLVGAMITFLIATAAFVLGRGRIPYVLGIAVLLVIALLHVGKGNMRDEYWWGERQGAVSPLEYPEFFGRWFSFALENLRQPTVSRGEYSLFERAGLLRLHLLVQAESPNPIPYLHGETYTPIPALLVPRILDSDKPASHEGTSMLNVHYGLQTRGDTLTTTIGWGLLNEAYANFGTLGWIGLAILLGWLYARIALWADHTPIASFRMLLAVLVLSLAVQTEFTAGVYVAALSQSTFALLLVTVLFMKKTTHTGMFPQRAAAPSFSPEMHAVETHVS